VEIQAGEGGDDSKLFVHDLGAAYIKYAKRNNLEVEIVGSDESHFSIRCSGTTVYALFESESGKHCIQRVPPTEKSGRRQTSTVAVIVTRIESGDVRSSLRPVDITITTMRGSGPGGQHKQKTDSCVRVRHNLTGLTVTIDGRDQSKNKALALQVLEEKVRQHEEEIAQAVVRGAKAVQWGGGNRSDKIRTYNYIESRAVDHRSGIKTRNVKDVIQKGKFELLK